MTDPKYEHWKDRQRRLAREADAQLAIDRHDLALKLADALKSKWEFRDNFTPKALRSLCVTREQIAAVIEGVLP